MSAKKDRKPWNAFPLAALDVRGLSPCAADCLRYLGIRSNYLGETVVGQTRMREDMNGRSKDYVTSGLKELEEKKIITTIGRKRSDSQADKHIISRSILSEEYRKVLEALEAKSPAEQENQESSDPASQDDAFFNNPAEQDVENPAFGVNNPAEQAQTLQIEPCSLKPNLTDQNPNKEGREGEGLASLDPYIEREELAEVLDQRALSRVEQIEAVWKKRTGRTFTEADRVLASKLIDQHGLAVVSQVLYNTLNQRPKSSKMMWTDFKVFANKWELNQDLFRAWAAWYPHQKNGYAVDVAIKFPDYAVGYGGIHTKLELTEDAWQQFKTNCTKPETWTIPAGMGRRALCDHLGVNLDHFARVVAYCQQENRLVSFDQFKALLLEVAEIVPEEPEPDQAKAAAAGFVEEAE